MRHLYTFRFYDATRHRVREIVLVAPEEEQARVAARQWLTAHVPLGDWRITSVRIEPDTRAGCP